MPSVPRGRCTALLLPPILKFNVLVRKRSMLQDRDDDDVVNVVGQWLVLAVNLVRDTH